MTEEHVFTNGVYSIEYSIEERFIKGKVPILKNKGVHFLGEKTSILAAPVLWALAGSAIGLPEIDNSR